MNHELTAWWIHGAATVASAALLSAGLIVVIYPLLKRHAVAKPTHRSSHLRPTPQGGGTAVIAATIVAACGALYLSAAASSAPTTLLPVFVATVFIAAVGAADDVRSVAIVPRLLLQALAVALVIYALPADLRVVPLLPWWIERALLVVGGLWFVNLVNFMDGLDWMTVAEMVPITAALALIGALGFLPPHGLIVALSLCGALIGFAYFNRPVAKLFLGDVGSLPIGLLVGWLLLLLAAGGHLAAAIMLPLYYLADASITLVRRLARGEPVWLAHRSHFYQLATDRGFTVVDVVARVFVVNIGLAALAVVTVVMPGKPSDLGALPAAAALVSWLLVTFARGKARKT